MSEIFDGSVLDRFEGMISAAEAELLYRLAAHLGAGGIVEIGAWRGKSAIALALGARANPLKPSVHCVEPHARFTGVYGGEFGPQDRTAFYKAMLESGCSEDVALVNLPSSAAAPDWPSKVGLLFIDGDHDEAAVEADVALWGPHLVDGGYIAFDDAFDPEVGPARVIARLLASGSYVHAEAVGKIAVLQKVPHAQQHRIWAAHSAAVADVRARAQAAGYVGDYAVARLSYGSFVSMERRYMFVETPKAACTSWKRLIVALEGAALELARTPYQRETRLDMLIHQRRYVGVPTLLDIAPECREEILGGSSDWHVFALCRNPFSRVVSVFENKVRFGEPGYQHLARFGEMRQSSIQAAFASFVSEIVADPAQREGDAHLQPQSELLLPKLIPYKRVYRIEEMSDALEALRAHLEKRERAAPISIERLNESSAHPWRSYYDEVTAAMVRDAYAADFESFGYDPTDWRGDSAELVESKRELILRGEIVARNAMIERLYDLLKQ